MVTFSSGAPLGDLPWPLAIAASIEVLESCPFLPLAIAVASREFRAGSGPPSDAGQLIRGSDTKTLTFGREDDIL